MNQKTGARIAYIDWLRGFACLLMFQTHCYDSWLDAYIHQGEFFRWSQLVGSLPAPLFLFLAGISVALVTDKRRTQGLAESEIFRKTMLRGLELFLLALLFRLQEFLLGVFHAPWTDLLRVDILNVIAISILLMGLVCRLAAVGETRSFERLRVHTMLAAAAGALLVVIATTPLWTTWQPHWKAWWLESYINGVHTYGVPQSWLFPIFPWSAFALVGLATGLMLVSQWARDNQLAAVACAGMAGMVLIATGLLIDWLPIHIYAVQDFWRTSPSFFMVRAGILMILLFLSYAWCHWGWGQRGFSPLVEMGKCSLLVYWIHVQFVYGGLSILPKHQQSIPTATLGLAIIFVAMSALATVRNRFPSRSVDLTALFRRSAA
jgi:uncharacterized membrane protein